MMTVAELPRELLELQAKVLRAERVYQQSIAALYDHPMMRKARSDGSLDSLSKDLRTAARAA